MKIWLNAIENELYRMLPQIVDHTWLEMVAAEYFPTVDEHLFNSICEPARDLVYRGGKRWRSLFMLLTANMLGGLPVFEITRKLVSLVELHHNGSLIIDDIEDGSDLPNHLVCIITDGIGIRVKF